MKTPSVLLHTCVVVISSFGLSGTNALASLPAAVPMNYTGDCKIQSIFLDLMTKQKLQLVPESRSLPIGPTIKERDLTSRSKMTFGYMTGASETIFLDSDLEVNSDSDASLTLKMRIGKEEVATSQPDFARIGATGAIVKTSVILSEEDALRAGFPSLAGVNIGELDVKAIPDHSYLWVGFRMDCAIK
jgi:hypothetical protein